jgi:hypothetical protein
MTNDTYESKCVKPLRVTCCVIYACLLTMNGCFLSVFAASQSVGFHEPQEMLQVLSLRLLSQAESYPISVYGIFAVRDDLELLRNYVFNRSGM